MAIRQISVPDELNLKLAREENASKLIRILLEEHYSKDTLSNMTEQQLIKELEIARIQEEAEKKINLIKNGNQ